MYTVLTPITSQICKRNHNSALYEPSGPLENLWPGMYYLKSIDAKFRCKYAIVPEADA